MTKEYVMLSVATIALATNMSGAAFAGDLTGSLDKTDDALKAAIELTGVTNGDFSISRLAFASELGSSQAGTASLSGDLLYGEYLSVAANADIDFATGDSSMTVTVRAEQMQTESGLFSFGISIDEDALSGSFDFTDVSSKFLANADFGLDFNTNYGSDTSLGLNATGQTVHGVRFTLGADLDLEEFDQSNFAIEVSYKF